MRLADKKDSLPNERTNYARTVVPKEILLLELHRIRNYGRNLLFSALAAGAKQENITQTIPDF